MMDRNLWRNVCDVTTSIALCHALRRPCGQAYGLPPLLAAGGSTPVGAHAVVFLPAAIPFDHLCVCELGGVDGHLDPMGSDEVPVGLRGH